MWMAFPGCCQSDNRTSNEESEKRNYSDATIDAEPLAERRKKITSSHRQILAYNLFGAEMTRFNGLASFC